MYRECVAIKLQYCHRTEQFMQRKYFQYSYTKQSHFNKLQISQILLERLHVGSIAPDNVFYVGILCL